MAMLNLQKFQKCLVNVPRLSEFAGTNCFCRCLFLQKFQNVTSGLNQEKPSYFHSHPHTPHPHPPLPTSNQPLLTPNPIHVPIYMAKALASFQNSLWSKPASFFPSELITVKNCRPTPDYGSNSSFGSLGIVAFVFFSGGGGEEVVRSDGR